MERLPVMEEEGEMTQSARLNYSHQINMVAMVMMMVKVMRRRTPDHSNTSFVFSEFLALFGQFMKSPNFQQIC